MHFSLIIEINDTEKSHLIGYVIGKYGVDIFAGSVTLKSIGTFKKLRDANRLCNLEAMAISQVNNEKIIISALKHQSQRSDYFSNVKIHWDKQNKHIPSAHNYEKGKGVIALSKEDINKLLKEKAGTGTPANNKFPGEADYRERVDFGKIIGEAVYDENGITKQSETTIGIIRYDSKRFAHITPAKPKL